MLWIKMWAAVPQSPTYSWLFSKWRLWNWSPETVSCLLYQKFSDTCAVSEVPAFINNSAYFTVFDFVSRCFVCRVSLQAFKRLASSSSSKVSSTKRRGLLTAAKVAPRVTLCTSLCLRASFLLCLWAGYGFKTHYYVCCKSRKYKN